MISAIIKSASRRFLYNFRKLTPFKTLTKPPTDHLLPIKKDFTFNHVSKRGLFTVSNAQGKETGSDWQILKRWDVPWDWKTVSLTSVACEASFFLPGRIKAALPYLGIQIGEITEKAELLLVHQTIATAAGLGVIYVLTNYKPVPDDFFRYDLRGPFNLRKGWIFWAGVGLIGAVIAVGETSASMYMFSGKIPQRKIDSLVRLLPMIGSSSVSTAYFVGVTGILAPLLEETVFRGFLMVSLTKWVPTPVAVLISASVFAFVHPGQFPQTFVLGTVLGFSYAQTHNLLTPITIHAFWNSGVILLLTYLKLQGYDINAMLQASQIRRH